MDWNSDGNLDIISGCYWTDGADGAHIQILTGNGDMDFAAAKPLENVSGGPLQNVNVNEGVQAEIKAICTEQHVVDYDNDGDLDLVVGCFGTDFFYYENKAEQGGPPAIVEQPVELSVKSTGHHSAPHLVDWDSDGDLDLLSGSAEGGVLLAENTGTREEPEWSDFKQLVPPSNIYEQSAVGDDDIVMGRSTRVWATDWNNDNLLDLVIGDGTSVSRPAEGVTLEEWKQRREEDNRRMATLNQAMQEFYPELEKLASEGKEPEGELKEKMEAINEKMMKIYEAKSEYDASEMTGYVWLLIQKPPAAGRVAQK